MQQNDLLGRLLMATGVLVTVFGATQDTGVLIVAGVLIALLGAAAKLVGRWTRDAHGI